ncbi:Fur family transcriptional regulator [Actinokineospora bangkokensis]|uniref:Transcriptional repressor n=1 Tax=Actinokineospora bangkokensis TaxID=1193682 RepID=A0A1Q9LLP6_9PSEU|nr:transcriptional repressor [Actinokineospora bangkokensis]OLR92950.1 transcriptional repressor [Actinokineospora bangkokensis]
MTLSTPPTPENSLRAAGLRVTKQRVAVLRSLDGRPHQTAADIALGVRSQMGKVATQTVYDVLEALVAAGLLRRIQPAGHAMSYESRVGDNHHHAICRRCGSISDIDCLPATAPCLAPPELPQFIPDEAEITFWGLCARCLTAA